MSFVSRYGGNQSTGKHTGMKGIRAALSAGMTINEIRSQLSKEGVQTGRDATAFLAARPSDSFIAQYGGNEETFGHSGLTAVNRAIGAGMSIDQIRSQAAREGVQFGSGAQAMFQREDMINNMKSQFSALQSQMAQDRAASQAAMREMQGSFAQALAAQGRNQSRVEGIRFADRGTGGANQQQLLRRGVRGTFGRSGDRLMKISALNV